MPGPAAAGLGETLSISPRCERGTAVRITDRRHPRISSKERRHERTSARVTSMLNDGSMFNSLRTKETFLRLSNAPPHPRRRATLQPVTHRANQRTLSQPLHPDNHIGPTVRHRLNRNDAARRRRVQADVRQPPDGARRTLSGPRCPICTRPAWAAILRLVAARAEREAVLGPATVTSRAVPRRSAHAKC
jgi:hypothetical protein